LKGGGKNTRGGKLKQPRVKNHIARVKKRISSKRGERKGMVVVEIC